jgi:hypothetical protein
MSLYELPLNEWIVIFYPQTGATRLCPSLDFAKNYIKSSSMTSIYKSPAEFRSRHDHHFLEKCWTVLYKRSLEGLPKSASGILDGYSETPPDVGTEQFVKLFWQFLQDVGDRLQAPSTGAGLTKDNYELKFPLMHALASDEKAFKLKYNNQARRVFTALLENGRQFLQEDEIRRVVYGMVVDRELKTKQDPWTVFIYYRPQFIKDGYIVRGLERAKKVRKQNDKPAKRKKSV